MLDDILGFVLEVIICSLPAKILFWLAAIVLTGAGIITYESEPDLAIIFLIIGVSCVIIALLITLFSRKKGEIIKKGN